MTRKGWAPALVLVGLLGACGGSDSNDTATPTTLPTTSPTSTGVSGPPVTASADCQSAFRQGHDNETGGMETFAAFRPSVQRCASLAEWTAAAKGIGVDLGGQEPVFVDRTCSFADDTTKARPICQEVKGKDG